MTAVAKKLHIRPGSIVWVRGEASRIGALPARAVVTSRASKRVTHAVLFVTKTAEIAAIARQRASLPPIVWIAYPKKTSGVSSELTRDEGWNPLFAAGFVGVASIAIDDTWSALRVRPGKGAERAKANALRAAMRRPAETRLARRPSAKLPTDLARAVASDRAAKTTLATLAPSHLREYADWIESAKKPATRASRIAKAVLILAAGQRDRNAQYR